MGGFAISNVFHSSSVPSGRARDPGSTSDRPNPASPSRWRAASTSGTKTAQPYGVRSVRWRSSAAMPVSGAFTCGARISI